MRLFFILITILIAGTGCTEKSKPVQKTGIEINKTQYGVDWPFTFEKGTLECHPGENRKLNVILIVDGKKYAVNGAAMDNARKLGFINDKAKLYLRDSDGFYTIGKSTRIIQKGLELCN